MTNKLSDKDKKDWQNFLNSSEKLPSKDKDQPTNKKIIERSIDLHGYTLEEANKIIENFINKAFSENINKLIIVTGKGLHSKNDKDPYVSKDFGILKNSVPNYIQNNAELMKLTSQGGGVGISVSRIRPRGAQISGNGKSEGVVPWCKIYDSAIIATNQGSVRRGAASVNLDINHIDKLNNNKPDLLTINNEMYNADPYLNKKDIKIMNNSIIGENLTIIYKNNTIEKLSTESECNKHSELEEETITNYEVSNKSTNYQDIINNEIFNKPRLTERQTKIFKYLSLQSTNINNAISKFKLILSKIDLNDANFFASHLRESTLIELKYKQLFGKYLDHFINALINKYNNGEDIFNNMNIMDFVTKLTK